MRFQGMDRNGDGVITRAEWRGSTQSFRVHDWNGDGVLSGEEVRVGGQRPGRDEDVDWTRDRQLNDWTEARFASLDHDGDDRIERDEWHYDLEAFRRADRNRDNVLTRAEFLGQDVDDDREDRFDYLDVNNNGYIERREWHGNAETFEWLDENNDNVISRAEISAGSAEPDAFASLDYNRNGVVTFDEWHGTRRSFNQRDRNGDGNLTREELGNATPNPVGTSGQALVVSATERWTDTGLNVRAGDRIAIDAQGTVQLSNDANDIAEPRGSNTGRLAPGAPLRRDLAGGLIARVGESAPVFVGSLRTFRAPASGRLYLGVNDDHLGDNRGEFRVQVSTPRR
jgi:Ca2+-binding EF-hand superfamily protein